MDANGLHYHLLLGKNDWAACRCAPSAAAPDGEWLAIAARAELPAEWDETRQELRLKARPFKFSAAPRDDPPDFERQRRSAAGDAFGNWYAVSPARDKVVIWNECGGSDFWPVATDGDGRGATFVDAADSAASTSMTLAGLTVTRDHYLLVGTENPAGVLAFDLYGGGSPLQFLWPSAVPFRPFDLAPSPDGGAWVLDRANKRAWRLDRLFAITSCTPPPAKPLPAGSFVAVGGTATTARDPGHPSQADLSAAVDLSEIDDPVAIDTLPDGTLLVLDRRTPPTSAGAARCFFYRDGAPLLWTAEGTPRHSLDFPPAGANTLRAYDMAVLAETPGGPLLTQIYLCDDGGNQAYLYALSGDQDGGGSLRLQEEYLPMRRFGGAGLASGAGQVRYDFAQAWVPLTAQPRPCFAGTALLRTKIFDGKEPQCIWHRLLLDARIPAETSVRIWSRSGDDPEGLATTAWAAEPDPYRRGDGSELPYAPTPWSDPGTGTEHSGEGTWELLFQNARGRYLELMLELHGNLRSTPRLRALRIYYPRFSYLREYLPAVYRDDPESARFLEGFLANIEGFYTATEDRIAAVDRLFDWRTAPPDALEWLAGWFGIALDPTWEDWRRRLFIRHAMTLFCYRGTPHGLRAALSLAFDLAPNDALLLAPGSADEGAFGVRIVEKYLARQLPDVLLGDPAQLEIPAGAHSLSPWKAADGGEALAMRYAAFIEAEASAAPAPMPFVAPADAKLAALWGQFTEAVLGFTPWAGALERAAWQGFLEREYGEIDHLNEQWGTGYSDFGDIEQPRDLPAAAAQLDSWTGFMRLALPARTPTERLRWQAFLRGRYGTVGSLNEAANTRWTNFDLVPLPDTLPADGPLLADWFQFEAGVLAILGAAHRFTVLLPMPTGAIDPAELPRRIGLARRIVDLEKPAHTTYDVRYYWAMFRVGEARLGRDSRVDRTTRDQLLPAMILGRGYLGESLVAPGFADGAPRRWQAGRDALH